MKKKNIVLLILGSAVLIVYLYYMQFCREPYICSSSILSNQMMLTVVSNKLYILDRKAFAEKIIKKCIDNDCKGVKFSYDISIPNSLDVTVYSSKVQLQLGNPEFSFSYFSDEKDENYNILYNTEKYKLVIE